MNADATLSIGFNPDFAPFSFERDGKATGMIINKIARVAEAAGFEVEFVAAPLQDLLPALEQGDVDLLAAFADTPARKDDYTFSKPLLISGAGWFVPIDQDYSEGDVPSSIVTPRQGPLASQIRNDYPDVEILTSNDYNDTLQDVLYGNRGAVAAALNWHVGSMLINEKYRGLFHMPVAPFNQIKLAMAGPKDNPERIMEKLNKHIPDEWGKL